MEIPHKVVVVPIDNVEIFGVEIKRIAFQLDFLNETNKIMFKCPSAQFEKS